ncbi:MAG: peptidylprolyl isomerase [Ilumatobacteraceae bacterium]
MGTAKRERQKANRQQRLEELAKTARREKTKRRGLTIAVVVIGGLLLLFGLAKIVGSDDESTAPLDTSAPLITLDPASSSTVDPASTTTVDPASTTTEGPTTTVVRSFEYGTAPCPPADASSAKPHTIEGPPQLCIDPAKTYTATVVTNKGEFTIALDTANAPGNVNNFVALSRYHYYDDSTCHRVITDFVVQCGRPNLDDVQAAEEAPGYTVADELSTADSYEVGTIAMANTGAPDSGGGQWFIVTGAGGVGLPPQYTVVGTVTKGLDTTVKVLAGLADPLAANGVPPLSPIDITSVTIIES